MKVHFAGHDDLTRIAPIKQAGINYVLCTFFKIKNLNKTDIKKFIKTLNSYKHTIIDSGLFTLMFGAKKNDIISEQFIIDWQNEYANLINDNNYKYSLVECDVQKKISPEFAWEMRKKFKKQCPNNTILNVYHLEDENPDKLIDFADYICVSIPELRFNVSRNDLIKITRYISQKALSLNKKVHLLGCTELKLMKQFQYCYSCDSTSWFSGSKYNSFKSKPFFNNRVIDLKDMKSNIAKAFKNDTISNNVYYWEAYMKLQEYKKYAGSQT